MLGSPQNGNVPDPTHDRVGRMVLPMLLLFTLTDNAVCNALVFGYLEVSLVLFLVTLLRIVSGAGVYIKIKYILLLLLGLGSIFVECNLNFILPIFYSLEFGTALFVIMVVKSCLNLWNGQGRVVWYGIPVTMSALFFSTAVGSVGTGPNVFFMDFLRNIPVRNEFVMFVLPLVKHQPNLLATTLLYILASTGVVITGRQTLLAPETTTSRKRPVSIFQKIRDHIFSLHKNIIHPFTPNH